MLQFAQKTVNQNTIQNSSASKKKQNYDAKNDTGLSDKLPFIQRKAGCACGGDCPTCRTDSVLQTKLKVSQPGDIYEQEADRVAAQVMRMSNVSVKGSAETAVQRQVDDEIGNTSVEEDVEIEEWEYEEEEDEGEEDLEIIGEDEAPGDTEPFETYDDEEEGVAMPKHNGESGKETVEIPSGKGQPLESSDRSFMEERFGRNFGKVRVHSDSEASDSARQLGAQAFTIGKNIYFGEGQYRPNNESGRQLLAHELTHVIQQSGRSLTSAVQLKPNKKQDKSKKPAGAKKIVVILSEQKALVMQGDTVVRTMSISSGKAGHETTTGTFSISERDKDHRSSTYGECVSKSGRRKVNRKKESCKAGETYEGAKMNFFQRFNGAEGFHQGPLPGHPASHGCVRLSTSNADWLWTWAQKGTKVRVINSRPKNKSPQKSKSKGKKK